MRSTIHGKRAEVTSQMFFYIAGAIVAVVIMIFGFNAILKLRDASQTAVDTKFQSDVAAFFESVQSSPFSSVMHREFRLLSSYDLLCFLKRSPTPGTPLCGNGNYCLYDAATGACTTGATVPSLVDIACMAESEENVFLISGSKLQKFKVVDVAFLPASNTIKCYPLDASSLVSFELESRGKQVQINYAGISNG